MRMSSTTGRGGASANSFRCSSLQGCHTRSLEYTDRRSVSQTTCRENLRLLLSLNSASAGFHSRLSGSNCMGTRPRRWARFSSWITDVFCIKVTRLMATVGTSAIRIRRKAFARGGSIPTMSKVTNSSLRLVMLIEKPFLNLAWSQELSMSIAAKAPQKSLLSGLVGPSAERNSFDCCSFTRCAEEAAASCDSAGVGVDARLPVPGSRALFIAGRAYGPGGH
mmetsp:Transcript_34573/g.78112  ORF Transcript_34573/g.78112 Transcript_34573/m.78112 type:complete len:222 (+) Transcript_34573:521-1186(+)